MLLLKEVGSAKRERVTYTLSVRSKTPEPQYQPIDGKKRKGQIVEDYSKDRAAQANKKALALLLKPSSPTPPKTGLVCKIVPEGHRKGNKSPAVLQGSAARWCISVPEHRV